MNTELDLRSIVRPKKPGYEHGKPHKVFDNQLNQNFTADEINRKWCTDFTYLFLANHEVRYNCTIIDLQDRSVIASITDRNITSDLAIRTLRKALESQSAIKEGLILHSCLLYTYTLMELTNSGYKNRVLPAVDYLHRHLYDESARFPIPHWKRVADLVITDDKDFFLDGNENDGHALSLIHI